MTSDRAADHWIAEIGARQAYLRDLLSDDDPGYAKRPPTGKWSVVENLQHLLFAEQAHFRRYLENPPPWSLYALPPTGMQSQKQFRPLAQPASSAREVLKAWAEVHQSTKTLAGNDSPQLLNRLERHVKHLNAHVTIIERLLRARGKLPR